MKQKLIILFFTTIVAMNVYAADVWDGSSDIFTHGAGTKQSPYLIENAEQLAFIAEMVNAGVYTYSGNYFKLTTDLDLNNLEWTPIGEATHMFCGNFDGDDHTISNLKVTSATNAGLFGVVRDGTFANISISGTVTSTASGNAGAVAGKAISNANFLYCKNMCSINGNISGGIVGIIENGMVKKCINHGNITATICAGGIVGQCNNNEILDELYNYGKIDIINTIAITSQSYKYTENANGRSKCNNYRTISTKGLAGGIVGNVTNFAQITACCNFGYVVADMSKTPYSQSLSYNTYSSWPGDIGTVYSWDYYLYTIQGYSLFGGIAGFFQDGDMNNCYNYGKVTGSATARVTAPYEVSSDTGGRRVSQMRWESNLYGGGLIGGAWSVDVYHSANVGDTNNKGQLIGGSINWNNKSGAKAINVEYSYDIRGISSNPYSSPVASYRNTYVAFLGENKGYFDANKNYITKTDAQMKSPTLPILLNTDSTIFIQDTKPYTNNGYPIFKTNMKVISNEVTEISYSSAMIIGNFHNCNPTSMGFEYKKSSASSYSSKTISNATPAQYVLTNLTQGTTYDVRYWLVDNDIKYYGQVVQFTTLACPTKPVRSDTITLCQGESYEFAGKTLSQAGVYHDSLIATTGCDSVVELVLKVTDTYKYPKTETINRGESYDFYGQQLTEPGVYNDYIRTTERCNWIELTLVVIEPDKTLILNVNNPQWGSVSGAGTYEHGSDVEFSASPAEGCYFVNWSDGETSSVRAISMVKDTTITANFAIRQYTITTQATNGTVTAGGTYNYGTQITLTATANEHYHFVRWSDGKLNATRQITITEDKSYTAIFEKDKFLVLFLDDDGTELQRSEVEYGTMPIAPANPNKESTTQYDYSFKGWNSTIVEVTQNATYTATYTSALRKYTVTFLDEDGSTLSSQQWNYGATPTCDAPTKPATAQYTYTFVGWNKEVVAVTGNATYTATYTSALRKYTVTFLDEDGSTLSSQQWNYGATPTCDEPIKPATAQYTYTFVGWNKEVVAVTGNATYTATYTSALRKYTVTFLDEDGSTLSSQQWNYGATPTCDEPTKPATAQYTYTFAGWTPEVVAVTGNATYTATYTSALRKYTVTFLDEDGSTLSSQQWNYGATPTCDAPTKPATAQYTYTFAGWNKVVVAVTGDATYTATYTSELRKYTVTFLDEDGSTLSSQQWNYGATPTCDEPTKPATAQYTYTFVGWNKEVVAVTGNATYTATYTSALRKYTVTFLDEDGSTLSSQQWNYGATPTCGEPIKPATAQYTYTFVGWTPEVVAVTGNVTYTATYTSALRKYTVTFLDEDGSTLSSQQWNYGATPTCGEPIKPATAQYTYTFAGWTPEVVAVTGNTTYTATYTSALRKYTVTFLDEDGSTLSSQQWNYGATPTCDAPTKPATAQYTYTFAGWTPEVVAVTGNATYTATYTSALRKYTVTFLDEDGSTLSSQQWNYGATPTCDAPTKPATAQYTYTFAGWNKEVVAVTGNATYTATYTSELRKYTITFLDEDNNILCEEEWEVGSIPSCVEPTKPADGEHTYIFAGWTPEVVAVTGDATYTATFSAESIHTNIPEIQVESQVKKVVHKGKVFIIDGDNTYTIIGQKVK